MSASATLKRHRTDIVSVLSADPHLILEKTYDRGLISARQYHILKGDRPSEEVIHILEFMLNDGETMCRRFLELLQTDEDLTAAFPGLKETLKDYVEEDEGWERPKMKLLSVLEQLDHEELGEFKWRLHRRTGIPLHRLEKLKQKNVMMDSYGDYGSWMETMRVLKEMNRNDLVQTMTETQSELRGQGQTKMDAQTEYVSHILRNLKSCSPSVSYENQMERILLDFLSSLTQDQFDEFKQHLIGGVVFKTESKLRPVSRSETVKMMIQTYEPSGAMEETVRVLKKMGSTDLVQNLKKICSTVEGPSTSDPSTPGPSTSDPSTPGPPRSDPSTPGPSTSDPSTPGPSTSDPSTPGSSTSDPSSPSSSTSDLFISDPSTPDPSTPGPSTPGPSTPDPSTPDPSTPGPSTPDPSTPGPSTPDPSTPGPSTPGPSTPGPSTSGKNLSVCEDATEDHVDEDDETSPHGTETQHYVSTEAQAGPSDWEEFTPEDSSESGTTLYRFRCPRSGSFRCTRTGLVFVVNEEAGLQYRTVQWDEDLLESASRTAAGPLFSIECPENAVHQLHFPHCEIDPAPLHENLLSVAHITPHGMGFIEALEITDTHVVIDVPHLSKVGVNLRLRRGTSKYIRRVSGQVLLFFTPPNTLEMHLLSINVDVEDVKAFVNREEPKAVYLRVAGLCKLITEHNYTVDCCYEDQKIHCKEKMFDLNFGPNYHMMFRIRLPSTTTGVCLTLKDRNKRRVWEDDVHLPDTAVFERPPQRRPPKKKLLSVGWRQRRPRLSGRRKIAGKYKRNIKLKLFGVMEDLEDPQFDKFKWLLNLQKWPGVPPIGKKLLENATRTAVVDLLVQRYEERGAVEVTNGVLQNMNMNELRKKLRNL